MRFAFDDDQLAFRDAVRDLLAKECSPATVRAAWHAPPGQLDRGVWDALAEMGVLSVLVDEADGGLGLDERSLVLLVEEAGYAGLPHPLVETALVAAPLVPGAATAGAMVAATSDAASLGAAAVAAADGDPAGGAAAGDRGAEATSPAVVPAAADADHLLLVGPGVAPHGALHLVRGRDVAVEAADAVDRARRLGRVTWTAAPATHLTDDPAAIAAAWDRGVLGAAALLVGLARRMLDLTVAYVSDREQFGAPVGSFQAVKHHLADAAKELAFARPVTRRAAWSLAVGAPEATRDAAMAKAMASHAAEVVGRAALQCHGAIGYTVEHDLHLFLKRSWALSRAWGDAAWQRDRVGTALGI